MDTYITKTFPFRAISFPPQIGKSNLVDLILGINPTKILVAICDANPLCEFANSIHYS
jgi:hypothetical protein